MSRAEEVIEQSLRSSCFDAEPATTREKHLARALKIAMEGYGDLFRVFQDPLIHGRIERILTAIEKEFKR